MIRQHRKFKWLGYYRNGVIVYYHPAFGRWLSYGRTWEWHIVDEFRHVKSIRHKEAIIIAYNKTKD